MVQTKNFTKFIRVVKAIQANPKASKDWLDVPVGCPSGEKAPDNLLVTLVKIKYVN